MNKSRVALFLGLTYAVNWLLVGGYLWAGGLWNTGASLALTVVYMFVPALVALALRRFVDREPLRETLGIGFKLNRFWLLAWLLPPVLAMASIGVALLLPGTSFSSGIQALIERLAPMLSPEQLVELQVQLEQLPIHPFWLTLIQALVAGITVNATAGLGEELGWRGYLFRELEGLGFWRRSLLTGIVWGVWHAPIILQGHNYPQHPVAGVFMMIAFTILMSPLFDWVRIRSGSVVAAGVLHGTINAVAGLHLMLVSGGTDLTVGLTGVAGFVVLLALNVGLWLGGVGRSAGSDLAALNDLGDA